jgi:fluoride exporter
VADGLALIRPGILHPRRTFAAPGGLDPGSDVEAASRGWGKGTVSVMSLTLVALGGALGSVARAVVGRAIPASAMPWGTILVNVLGSLLIGWLIGRMTPFSDAHLRTHSFWVIGFCGGFTTFSTFSWQTFEQIQKGNWPLAAANVVISVLVCLTATWLGWRLAR